MNKINGAGSQPFINPDAYSGKVRPVEPKAETPKPPAFNPEAEPKMPPGPSIDDLLRIQAVRMSIQQADPENETE